MFRSTITGLESKYFEKVPNPFPERLYNLTFSLAMGEGSGFFKLLSAFDRACLLILSSL
jgi:hypothetical protein